ncbi:two-component response regulator-like APRR3 isoform X6 [Hevea brasiliensis]|uniref:two-component response regulator-like APRR3 isoform X6 n=1 Tax=Hevea brasiliensis TaxID=3981 RepID=UPI0025F59B7F|nr:two-component response regulator-like APRR3 isoform X6 [Hevea brasiliensis]
MFAVAVTNGGVGEKGLADGKNNMCCEQKEDRNGMMGDGQGLGSSEEDDTRVDDAPAVVNNGPGGSVQVHDGCQIAQQQSQNSVIRWERFLPIRSLKVLLVENDDSTRHVVSALLRNCSYEVTAVANGIQAWKILEDLNNHIDLILTEVVMPILSGIGLLCKIMSHKTLKNIPVIMMSSRDSMGIVFKCLSKGAVDFLVKPIRKNELKNLWQHVWRRCHSSSGSGSESGTQSKKSTKTISNEESGNNSDSSNELYDNGSYGLSNQDGSDKGSGTQSSWTKRTAEFDSPRPISPSFQLADAPDSTCAQVIHTKPETFSNRWVHVTEAKECQQKDDKHDDIAMGKDLEIGASSNPGLQHDCQCENFSPYPKSIRQSEISEMYVKPLENGKSEPNNENIFTKLKDQTPKTASTDANSINPHVESKKFGSSGIDVSQLKDKSCCDSGELPSLELTLKRLKGVRDCGNAVNDDRNVLRHSDLSPFSNIIYVYIFCRYNTASSANQPVQNGRICSPQQVIPGKVEDVGSNTVHAPFMDTKQQVEVQHQHHHHHHHHHHYHHHVHNIQQHQSLPDHDDISLKNMAAVAPQCGSSNVLGGRTKDNTGNYSMNGSVSGSNHGSNGQNGSSTALNNGLTYMESDNREAGNNGAGGISGRNSGNALDEDRVAQRVAALSKFRQKRKERCFEKRVRYQSRKKLAEQRPRVKGQFVRQTMSESILGRDCQSNDVTSEDNSCDLVR